MRGGAALLAVVVLASAACHRQPASARTEPLLDVFRKQARAEGLSRVETDGKRLFAHYCATCHGDAGQGDGQNAYNLDPQPPNFSQSLKAHPSSYWRQIVEGGSAAVGRSPLCPPWGHSLQSTEIDALIDYLSVLARPPAAPASPAGSQDR
jgi:mono/diheme cytochrome c family protein